MARMVAATAFEYNVKMVVQIGIEQFLVSNTQFNRSTD